jgi:hypothetical protein
MFQGGGLHEVVAGLGCQGDEFTCILVDVWPLHLQLFDFDGCALLLLRIMEVGPELAKKLVPEVYVVWARYYIKPVSLLDRPWCHRGSLDKREDECDPRSIGLVAWEGVVETEVVFYCFNEVIRLFSVSVEYLR